MKSLNVGIFNDPEIGGLLGKKGTESDIIFHDRKEGDTLYTFMQPAEGKLTSKAQIMSAIDAAIVSFENRTPELGETILMLDAMGISAGVAVMTPGTDVKEIVEMTRGTSLESYTLRDRSQQQILETLSKVEPARKEEPITSVAIDHAFSVKGVGEVALGFVKTGTVKKHQKLKLLPSVKEIVIRSIQMHDKDYDEALAGSRVGLAVKGTSSDEMKRGTVLSEEGICEISESIKLSFSRNSFYKGDVSGKFHASVGMQTFPVEATEDSENVVTIKADRPVVFRKDENFIVLDINAEKVHFIGSGTPS